MLISTSTNNNEDTWFNQTLSELLNEQIHIYHASDAETAIGLLAENPVDVILSNEISPTLNAQLLENLPVKQAGIPFIVMANTMDASEIRETLCDLIRRQLEI